jgi:hypothetical protein
VASVSARRPGDWSLLRTHIHEVICSGREREAEYLLGWMADLVQNPGRKPGVMLCLQGREGTGRGTLGHVLCTLLGTHGIYVSSARQLLGRFNAFMAAGIFLFADEAFFPGDKAHIGLLKSLLTEERQLMEAKYKQQWPGVSYLRIMSTTNEPWVVPAGLDSRRFFVLRVSDAHMQERSYFAAIDAQMNAGGYEAMLYDLLRRDLHGFDAGEAPVTEELLEQRERSLQAEWAWWQDVLSRGYVWESQLGLADEYFGRWHEDVTTELLYASYRTFLRGRPLDRRALSREGLGKFLADDVGAQSTRLRNRVVGEHRITQDVGGGRQGQRPALRLDGRPRGYWFNSLAVARQQFTRKTGLTFAVAVDREEA